MKGFIFFQKFSLNNINYFITTFIYSIMAIHDLHYSYKDVSVLAFMKEVNLVPLYISAGCIDIMQTCDTVANNLFKVEIIAAFRDYFYR